MENTNRPLPRILYIEDNADARSLVRRLMFGRYQMLEAKDPIDGMQLAEQCQPDLVLLDMNLPGMTGFDAATRLIHILKPGTPVVALTADYIPDIRERALAAGFSGFLDKPINIDTFYDLINSYLRGKREQPAAGGTRPQRTSPSSI
jgi:CheY-like chemotaxis protein